MTINHLPLTSATDTSTYQLELFPAPADETAPEERGISRAVARASLTPGAWQHVAVLYDGHYFRHAATVNVCHMHEGVLVIDATLSDDHDALESTLKRIREVVARTCGCCGTDSGRPCRVTLDGPTRVVCEDCRARLRAGEAELSIADDYFHLDGSLRGAAHGHTRPPGNVVSRPATTSKRACSSLAPDQLRRVIAEIREHMTQEIVGNEAAVARVALLAALHACGGLTRGGRALVLGPSGSGKTTLVNAAVNALAPWDIAHLYVSATDITSPGFSGAPSIGELIATAMHGVSDEGRRKAFIAIDEIHHIGVVPHSDITGNTLAHRADILSSLLQITGGGITTLPSGDAWSSKDALVIVMGAFTNTLHLHNKTAPSLNELIAAGLPVEVASRIAEDVIVLKVLSESALVQLLQRWPALISLSDLCARLGFRVRILPESYAHAARIVTLGHDASTARTAGAWLVSALRQALLDALAKDSTGDIVIAPDSLSIPPIATRPQPPDDPPGAPGDWDATLILTPRR